MTAVSGLRNGVSPAKLSTSHCCSSRRSAHRSDFERNILYNLSCFLLSSEQADPSSIESYWVSLGRIGHSADVSIARWIIVEHQMAPLYLLESKG
jgi:hypothetical protein